MKPSKNTSKMEHLILKLVDSIRPVSVNTGEYIVSCGEKGDAMYTLFKGKLCTIKANQSHAKQRSAKQASKKRSLVVGRWPRGMSPRSVRRRFVQ